MANHPVTGFLTRLEANGFGVVKLDGGKEGFFDRFAMRASQNARKLRPGSRIIGETKSMDTEVIRLESVGMPSR